MNKNQLNIAISIVLILFGIAVLVAIPYCVPYSNLHSGLSKSELLSSHFMPKVLVNILFFSCAVNIVINVINLRALRKSGREAKHVVVIKKGESSRLLAFMLIFLLYAFLLNYIGFLLASIICCVILLLVMKEKTWWYYAIDIGFVLVVYLIFKYLLYVQL